MLGDLQIVCEVFKVDTMSVVDDSVQTHLHHEHADAILVYTTSTHLRIPFSRGDVRMQTQVRVPLLVSSSVSCCLVGEPTLNKLLIPGKEAKEDQDRHHEAHRALDDAQLGDVGDE